MPIFFVKNDDIDKIRNTVRICGDDSFHIARALRMAVGDEITVSTGEEKYQCVLDSIHDSECVARIEKDLGRTGEAPYFVSVYQALPKGDKLETVIQKSVECGACGIFPFVSEFCTVKPKDASSEQKKDVRRNKIAYEAAKQCRRTVVPTVGSVMTFSDMLSSLKESDIVLFCYENERENLLGRVLSDIDATGKKIAVVIGSEGGFSEREASRIKETGAIPISLGERILRCESAGMFVLSAMSAYFEL